MTDYAENKILTGNYALFDRILYGGIGYGTIIIPIHFVKIIFTLIFPPLGQVLNIIGDYLLDQFPYITWDTLMMLLTFENINKIIYTFVLTSMFYIPGLIYTLAQLTTRMPDESGTLACDPDTGECIDLSAQPIPT